MHNSFIWLTETFLSLFGTLKEISFKPILAKWKIKIFFKFSNKLISSACRINNGAARLRQIEQSFRGPEDAPAAASAAVALPIPPMFQSSKKKVTIVEDKNTESCV